MPAAAALTLREHPDLHQLAVREPVDREHSAYIFLLRDATIGVECPDTFAERIATRWAVRYFETHFGDTVLCEDFVAACGKA